MNRLIYACIALGLVAAGCERAQYDISSKGSEGYRCQFDGVQPVLRAEGKSSYMSLIPGTVHVYSEDETRLTITVLNETREVDGVMTRIIEEREETKGVPEEISRNYFAIDQTTGDVYYFGEDVDIYKGGKLSSHDGAWHSGVRGAKFGLGLPGTLKVGDTYCQEYAPGVAMDRAEIVSVDETVLTPAGEFKHCVHVKETTPLEPGDIGHKWYAPGIGLIRDGKAMLAELPRIP